ncbi:MAG: hypothetical protein ABIP07_02175 [Sphingomicrobium sp.]
MMFWLVNDNRPWFRARTYGFGAGLPLAWQGWALLALHVALILGVTLLLRASPVALVAAVMALALAPMPIYAARTEGGWRWRWGDGK